MEKNSWEEGIVIPLLETLIVFNESMMVGVLLPQILFLNWITDEARSYQSLSCKFWSRMFSVFCPLGKQEVFKRPLFVGLRILRLIFPPFLIFQSNESFCLA